MNPNDQDFTIHTPSPKAASRLADSEYRDGYVQGYTDSANEILAIFESAFAGTLMMQYARERFAEKVEAVADLVANSDLKSGE